MLPFNKNQFLMYVIAIILLNPFQLSVALNIETSHLIWKAEQMTGFYMKCNTGLKLG